MDAISLFRRTAARERERTFAFDAAASVTYGEADLRSDSIAAELTDRGISTGAPLALCAPDSVNLVLAILGCWKAGGLPALIDARTTSEDLPFFLDNIGAKLVVAPASLQDRLKAAGAAELEGIDVLGLAEGAFTPSHGPDSPLYLSYTSGTTGLPKGAVLNSAPVVLGTACIADRLELRRDDILLATTPTSSSFQLVAALLPAIHVGAAIGLVAGLTVDGIWDVAGSVAATVLIAYPLTLADVVHAPQASTGGSAFRLALSGGSPLAPRIKHAYRERLGISLVESYGQSELGGFMALGRPGGDERYLSGFVGKHLPDRRSYIAKRDGTEVTSGEVGEVVVPEGYFAGYWGNLDATRRSLAGGVLHTGDVGVSDADGFLKVLGRTREADRAAHRGGYLRELEDVLYDHPEVKHAAVVETGGGAIAAYVELLPGATTAAEELTGFAADRVVEGLRPERLVVLESMPRSFSGKADRKRLEQGAMT